MSAAHAPTRGAVALSAAAALALAACSGGSAPAPITAEPKDPPVLVAPPELPGEMVTADTYTINYAPLGFKVALAFPHGGHLCIILPESAQDPTACMGLDPAAMVDALPPGPERPFGAAYARMGDWSYIVMLAPAGRETDIESREDIEEFLAGALKPDVSAPAVVPRLVPPSDKESFEILRVEQVPVVKFRIDVPVPENSPQYDISSSLHYAAFGGKAAMVSFITSPKDMEKLMPYADATIQSLVLPAREAPERFGKPRGDISHAGTRTAIMILGPLAALGALLLLWLGRSAKEAPEAPAAKGGKPETKGGKRKQSSD